MSSENSPKNEIPNPEAFRVWLRASLKILGVGPYALPSDMKVSRNTVAHFLSTPESDIRLGTASEIHANVCARAKAAELEIPELFGVKLDG